MLTSSLDKNGRATFGRHDQSRLILYYKCVGPALVPIPVRTEAPTCKVEETLHA